MIYWHVFRLNVGGRLFASKRYTLTRTSLFFRAMLESPDVLEVMIVHWNYFELYKFQGPVFLDRDPRYFEEILMMMRGGVLNCT
jgi:hypothetical protein